MITLNYICIGNEIVGFVYKDVKYYFLKNIQGDIIKIYDESNNLVASYSYDAWGNHKVYNSSGSETTSATHIGNINPFRYRGYYYDRETNLYYCNTRYYNPELCRWMSMDSVNYAEANSINGLNLYAYCMNNPVNVYRRKNACSFSTETAMYSFGIGDSTYIGTDEEALWYTKDMAEMPDWAKYVVGGLAIAGLVAATILTFGIATPASIAIGTSMFIGGAVSAGLNIVEQLSNKGTIDVTQLAISTLSGIAYGMVMGLTNGIGVAAIISKLAISGGTSLLNSWNGNVTNGQAINSFLSSMFFCGGAMVLGKCGPAILNRLIFSKFSNNKSSWLVDIAMSLWEKPEVKTGIIRFGVGLVSVIF